MAYRANVLSSEAAANGDVHLDVIIQKEVIVDQETTWATIPNGHRTMVLDGAAVLAVTGGDGTLNQKRAAIVEIMRAEATRWGIGQSDQANTELTGLVPGGFPIAVVL